MFRRQHNNRGRTVPCLGFSQHLKPAGIWTVVFETNDPWRLRLDSRRDLRRQPDTLRPIWLGQAAAEIRRGTSGPKIHPQEISRRHTYSGSAGFAGGTGSHSATSGSSEFYWLLSRIPREDVAVPEQANTNARGLQPCLRISSQIESVRSKPHLKPGNVAIANGLPLAAPYATAILGHALATLTSPVSDNYYFRCVPCFLSTQIAMFYPIG